MGAAMAPALRPAELCCLLLLLAALPRGAPRTVRLSTDEEAPPGTVLGALGAELAGLAAPGEALRFRLVQPAGAGGEGGRGHNGSLVRLREADGQLSVGEAGLDRERLCGRAPRCLLPLDVLGCGAGAGAPRCRLLHVELEVRDVNDHAPRFPQPLALEVSESAAPGTRLPLALPVDEDVGANGVQRFQLSPNAHFGVEVEAQARADGGRGAALVLLRALDREAQAAHALELVAADGGSPARSGTAAVRVRVLDANDNSPAFAQAAVAVELREDAAPGAPVLALSAADPDEGANGEVVYGFGSRAAPEARRLFRLDPRSGRLTLAAPLDYERQRAYELDVEARDRGASPLAATCTVLVRLTDVNDNAPGIRLSPLGLGAAGPPGPSLGAGSSPEPGPGPGVLYVSEAAPRDSFVALVSTWDRDSGANGQVRCTLHGHEHFALRRAYGDSYVLVTAAALDRERLPEYNLTLVAEDLGTPPFRTVRPYTVRLRDENDNAPLFAPPPLGRVAVPENNPPGAYLATVLARDPDLGPNGKVTYRLLEAQVAGAPVSTYVSLDPATGALYALRTFNYEVLKQLDLRIEASDSGTPPLSSTTLVTVTVLDQNDNAPIIVHPALNNGSVEIRVFCKAPPGSPVAQIQARDADDGDNAELTFSFLPEPLPQQELFAIDRDTGEIMLTGDMSEELGQTFKVILTVMDHGQPPLSTTATVSFLVTATVPSSSHEVAKPSSWEGKALQWDVPLIVIIVLAGSCTLLLVAIITIATTCNKRKKETRLKNNGPLKEQIDISHLEKVRQEDTIPRGNMFEVRAFPSKVSFTSPEPSPATEEASSSENNGDTCLYEGQKRLRGTNAEPYASASNYSKELTPPVPIWKGHSFNTISGREAEKFSGKDSGKGDSDFNDSDSDISGEALKKDLITHMQNGLWACTAECKILGHSDRCWSPSCGRSNTHSSPRPPAQLSSFCKSTSLPRDPLHRDSYYQAQLPKTVGLQSVYEKVLHRDFDRTITLLSPPHPGRLPDLQEIGVPLYQAASTRYIGPQNDASEKV